MVGAGNWGKNLIRNFAQLGALAGVAEVNPQLRAAVAEQYPHVALFTDYEQALASSAAALVLATPAPTHFQLALTALAAGKDVFVEKPMTLKSAEARQLAEYANQQSRILMVGHLLLYQPAIRWMRDYLQSGQAGKVYHVATQRLKLGRVRREENVWWSFAPHDVSVVLALLGNPLVQEVQAQGQAILQSQVEDDVHVSLAFEGGKTGHLHCSWYWPEMKRSTTVIAEREMLVYDEISQRVTVYNKGIHEDLSNRDEGSWSPEVTESEPLKLECEHFLDCLETRQQPRSNGWNGVAVVEVLEKVQGCLDRSRQD